MRSFPGVLTRNVNVTGVSNCHLQVARLISSGLLAGASPGTSRVSLTVIFGILFLASSVNANAEELTGLVVRIISGDAVVLLDAGRHEHEIRLTQIIAPKKTQPWGAKSKQALARMIYHKDVIVYVEGKDKYGRTLGRIYLHGKDINRAMLDQGEAWVYRKYVTDTSLLDDEEYAQGRKLGLFSQPHPIPPWEWRRGFAR